MDNDRAIKRRIIRKPLSSVALPQVSEDELRSAEELNQRIQQMLTERAPNTRNGATLDHEQGDGGGQAGLDGSLTDERSFSPSSRMAEVRTRGTAYEREYRLDLISRMLIRNIPPDRIATDLGISLSQYYKDTAELNRRYRATAQSMDIDQMIGRSIAFYDEAAALGMRAASMENAPLPVKLAGVRTSLAAHNDKYRFMETAGVFDVLRYRRANGGAGATDIETLMARTDEVLSGVARRSAGLSFSDVDSDTSSQEQVEL